jgi:hypothetical protein
MIEKKNHCTTSASHYDQPIKRNYFVNWPFKNYVWVGYILVPSPNWIEHSLKDVLHLKYSVNAIGDPQVMLKHY